MPEYTWLISAVVAWIIFFLLVDWSRLKYTLWGGLFVVALQLLVDSGAMDLNLYHVNILVKFLNSSVFFTFGVVFVVGVLFAQTLPSSRWLQALDILVTTALFCWLESLFVKVGVLEYINWNQAASTAINFLAITSYAWLVDSLGLNQAGSRGIGRYKL
ncbi:MAG: hypothetical protein PHP51_08410 [Desulfotomaculaceae bacterium]|nr:hypothetical protein [Desulfotomaculaceae bacterium]